MEFVLVHVTVAASILVLMLTVRLEAFFALTVFAGFHGAGFYVIPFTVTSDLVQSMVSVVAVVTGISWSV